MRSFPADLMSVSKSLVESAAISLSFSSVVRDSFGSASRGMMVAEKIPSQTSVGAFGFADFRRPFLVAGLCVSSSLVLMSPRTRS